MALCSGRHPSAHLCHVVAVFIAFRTATNALAWRGGGNSAVIRTKPPICQSGHQSKVLPG